MINYDKLLIKEPNSMHSTPIVQTNTFRFANISELY